MPPSLPADKANHAVYGNVAALAAVGVAAAKEIWDYTTGKGKPELADFAATCAGGAPLAFIAWRLAP